ncbi:MAG TPA: DUF2723 domain-containing protein [Fibrobacteria bacterium]|jgi:hypothetical protein|nr:DUF2723 domain-containing protein [Fibrobacteria bacterium]
MSRIAGFRSKDNALGLLISALAFAVYLLTLSPAVGGEDSGEIATSLHTLGILHPTGYPVFTLLGHAFSALPLGGRVIWRLNLLVAILCAAAVFAFYRLFLFLLSEQGRAVFGSGAGKGPAVPASTAPRALAASAALALAFSRTFWSEGVSLEVYAFHLLLLATAGGVFLRVQSRGQERLWPLFGYVLGLGFANHMMTVLLAPAFLYLHFRLRGFGNMAWKPILRAVPTFVLGLSPYLYLPIRAAADPLMNWGDPSTFGRFWDHITVVQYRAGMFSSGDVLLLKAQEFFATLPAEFGYAPLLGAAVGAWVLWRESRQALVFGALLFFGCVLYGFNYNVEDPNFYLNAHLALAFFLLFGLRWMTIRAGGRALGWTLLVAVPLFPLCLNYSAADKSHDYVAEDFARNMLASVDSGAILVAREERTFLMPALYLQVVEGTRADVAVLDYNLMAFPWFYRHLERRHPGLLEPARPEVEEYLRAYDTPLLPTFADTLAFRRKLDNVVNAVMWRHYPARAIYATQAMPVDPNRVRLPEGLAFRLYQNGFNPPPAPLREMTIRPLHDDGFLTRFVREDYARAFTNQGLYRAVFLGDTALGLRFLSEALGYEPGYAPALQWMRRLRAGATGRRAGE